MASTLTFFFTVALAFAAKCKSMSSEVKQFACCFCFRFEIFIAKGNGEGVESGFKCLQGTEVNISDERFHGSIMQPIKLSAKRLPSGCCLNCNDFLMTCLGVHHPDQKFEFYGRTSPNLDSLFILVDEPKNYEGSFGIFNDH